MTPVSPSTDEIARLNQTAMLQAFAELTGATVAERMGVSEATVSRFKTDETERCAKFLAALGLKCVPISAREFDEEVLNALLTLSRRQLASVKAASDLASFCRGQEKA